MPDTSLLFSAATLPDGSKADLRTKDARIAELAGPGTLPTGNSQRIDCRGLVLSPSFVEGHIHLDKTLLGLPFIPHLPADSVAGRIAREKELRRTLPLTVFERGGALIEQIAAFGTGQVRSLVVIDTEIGLKNLENVVRLKDAYKHLLDIQIVAFPQSGILRDPGTAAMLDAALANGADLVGGLDPAGIDGDATLHLDVVFGLAEKHGAGIDIHLHDGGETGLAELGEIARRTESAGLGGKVVVSHAYCLGDPFDIDPTAAALARAGVAIMTNGPAGPVPMPPVKRLTAAGITVFTGSDNIRDAWEPYGNGDMLERAWFLGYRQGFYANEDIDRAFAMTTTIAAHVLGLSDYGFAVGNRADLVLLEAGSAAEAVVTRARRKLVVKSGRIIARDGVLVS